MVTQAALLAQALGLAAVVWCGKLTPWYMLVFAAAAGVVNALDLPARLAFVVDMVGRDDLHNAVALNSLMFNAARVVGPALGALLLWLTGPALCFLLNALSFLAVLAALALMDVNGDAAAGAANAAGPVGRPPLRGGKERFAIADGDDGGGRPVRVADPVAADGGGRPPSRRQRQRLRLRHVALRVRRRRPALDAAGRLLRFAGHAAAVPRRRRRPDGGRPARPGGAGSLTLALPCCALLGGGLILFNSTSQTIMQLSADDHNRGRVLSIWSMVLSIAAPVGGLAAGQAVDLLDVPAVLAVLAAGLAASAAVVFVLAGRQTAAC